MTLYGITGPKYHGKDTFSRAVVEASEDSVTPFTITHFADTLKRQAIEIFGVTDHDVFDPQGKETPLPTPIRMDDYLVEMCTITGLAIQPRGLIANTPRELLQFYGTEYVRTIQEDYWIQKTLDVKNRVLVSDTRFPDEAEAIRQEGGKIIKVFRVDMPKSSDQHASETLMKSIHPDLLLYVKTGDFSRIHTVARHIALDEWEEASVYHNLQP